MPDKTQLYQKYLAGLKDGSIPPGTSFDLWSISQTQTQPGGTSVFTTPPPKSPTPTPPTPGYFGGGKYNPPTYSQASPINWGTPAMGITGSSILDDIDGGGAGNPEVGTVLRWETIPGTNYTYPIIADGNGGEIPNIDQALPTSQTTDATSLPTKTPPEGMEYYWDGNQYALRKTDLTEGGMPTPGTPEYIRWAQQQEQDLHPPYSDSNGNRWSWVFDPMGAGGGHYEMLPSGTGSMSDYDKEQLDLQKQNLALQQQQAMWQMQYQQQQIEQQKQQRLSELRSNPGSWLQYHSEAGTNPSIQPWMIPLMGQQYAGAVAGQDIPNWQGNTPSLADLPNLTNPSAQYYARMSPSAQAQYGGYQQARTGETPEDLGWRLWNAAPPSGQNLGLNYKR